MFEHTKTVLVSFWKFSVDPNSLTETASVLQLKVNN